MTQLFISHSSKNNAEALALSQWLTAEGWDAPFLDFEAQHGIAPGDDWKEQIRNALARCRGFLALVSPDWRQSDWCQREFAVAQYLGEAKIFGLLLHGTSKTELPEGFSSQWQVISLSSGTDLKDVEIRLPKEAVPRTVSFSESALRNLGIGLKRWGLNPELFPWPPAKEPNRVPYRGLAALEADDAGIFFGREAPIADLLAQLRILREAAPSRLMVILGASGAGKSSFLRAGIWKRLERDDRHFLPLPVIRPERAVLTGSNGLVECLWTMRRERKLNWSRRQIEEAVATGAPALQPLLQELAQHCQVQDWDGSDPQPPNLVLAIDQAEELFQAEGTEQGGRFLSLLAELLQADTPKLIVLCTIRSDSYEPLQSAPALADTTQRIFSLPPMPHGAFRQVIEAPVALLKDSPRPLHIEPQLTEALLRDIAEGGAKDALPLLAFTLERLYVDYSADDLLSLKDYQDLGRIAGAIEKAVAAALEHAQRNPKLPNERDECLKLLRRGLIPWMAGIDRHSNLPYRKVARLAQIPEEARALIEHFVEHRLLAKDKNPQGETTIEPAHEALLRQWTTLKGWLEEDTTALATLESVKAASRDWDANKRSPEWLTHAAGRLEDAEALNQRPDLAESFGDVDRAYLAECKAREHVERDRELRQTKELVEQRGRIVRRTRVGLAVASCLLAIAVVLAALAWQARLKAAHGLTQAAERALGRAREQMEADKSNYLAYLAESLSYSSDIAAEEAAIALQQSVSPVLIWAIREHTLEEGAVSRVAAFSPDGGRVLTASWDSTARLLDAATGAALGNPMRHGSAVSSATFSADGLRLVTASFDKTARLWDAETGVALGEPLRHDHGVNSATLSPDGQHVVTTSFNKTAQIWDALSGVPVGMPMVHLNTINSAAFSPDGRRIVTSSFDRTAQLWNGATGATLGTPMRHEGWVSSAKFSPDGLRVVTASSDGTARQWDGESGSAVGKPLSHEEKVNSASFSPDGLRIVTTSMDGTVRQWDALSGVAVSKSMPHKRVTTATFSPDGLRILSASGSHLEAGTAQLWDAVTGGPLGTPMHHDRAVRSPAFSHDGRRLLTAGTDNSVRLWEASSGTAVSMPIRHASPAGFAVFSPDGLRVVTASENGTAQLWDAVSGTALGTTMRHEKAVRSVAFSPDGQRVLTASWDNTARLWDPATGAAISVPMRHEKAINSAAFSPNGQHVVTASADNTARLWDTATGAALGTPMRHAQSVSSAAFSSDGLRVVTSSWDGTARLWNAGSGAALGTPMRHDNPVYSASFSPNGQSVVTAGKILIGGLGAAWIWDAATGERRGIPMRHDKMVNSALFSPDGLRVVTASADNTVRIWDSLTGLAVGAPFQHEKTVYSASFSPDGLRVVTASEDCTVRIWDVGTAQSLVSRVYKDDLLALSGRLVAGDGKLDLIAGPEWTAIIKASKAHAESEVTLKGKVMRWHFAARSTRPISPFSKITVRQHIEREIDWVLEYPQSADPDGPHFSPKILDDAYNLDPGHPLILLALSVFETRPETKALWKRLSFPRFDKDPRLAARAAEILLIDKDPTNARKAAEIALALSSATEEDKDKASAVLTKITTPNTGDTP